MSTISKPGANPILAAILSWGGFPCFALGHLIINGQTKKWLFTLICTILCAFCLLIPGLVMAVLSMVDAYQTATRLAAGEEIPEGEFSNPLLFKVVSMIYKDATCANAAEA